MAKLLLRVDVVETDDDDITIHLKSRDPHLEGCPSCLANYSLRIANAFFHACGEAAAKAQDDDEDTAEHNHPLH